MKLTLVHLYPKHMNIYGDQGNLLALIYRCRQRRIKLLVKPINPGDSLKPGCFDLLFAGGGQDRHQSIVAKDLIKRSKVIKQAVKNHIPMLTICGSYQLFGRYFQPFNGPKLKGIGIFDAYTVADRKRKIGNAVIRLTSKISDLTSNLVGFENHSGNTFLSGTTLPLGQVIIGSGNNGQDHTEGAVVNQAFGCYLHGSLLPKNPHFADYLIHSALQNRYGSVKLQPLNDQLEWQAHSAAVKRANKLAHPLIKYF